MLKNNAEKKLFWVVVAAKVAFVLAVVAIFGEGRLIWGDGGAYLEVGGNIWRHARFGRGAGGLMAEGAAYMPLLPIVAGFFSLLPAGITLFSLLQAFAAGGIAILTYRIALRFVSARLALPAALVVAFQPTAFLLNALVMTETLALFFLMSFAYLFLHYRDTKDAKSLALSAVALALAVLTRNALLYLAIIPVIFLLVERAKIRRLIMFLAIPLILLAPWLARNEFLIGSPRADTGGSDNVCGYQLFATYAAEHDLGITRQFQIWEDPVLQEKRARCLAQGDVARVVTIAREHPRGFLKANALTTLALLTNDGVATFFQRDGALPTHHNYLTPMVLLGGDWRANVASALRELAPHELLVIFGLKLFWLVVLALAVVGAARTRRRGDVLFLLLIAVYLVSVTVLSTAFGVGARLRYPIEPFMFILAALALHHD